MKRFFVVPGLAALMVFAFATAIARPAHAAPIRDAAATAASAVAEPAKPFFAQVVGLIWMNPLQRKDYPTEWQLLWTQGLAAPNKNDDMVRTDPESFTTLQSVAGIAYGNDGEETFKGFYHKYVNEFIVLPRSRYFSNPKYFYTVASKQSKDWRELAGVRIEFALPPRLDPVEAKTYLVNEFIQCFEIGPPSPKSLWSRDTPPDVHITQGGANAGFTSLNNALDYLQQNPDKSVWAM
ncbi:virulence factor, partial [Burkholderia vietnamiensis]|nr:virulence factor [Burkholderia vietnamiensis]